MARCWRPGPACAAIGPFGQPWIFRETRALIGGARVPAAPNVHERFEIALEHARLVQAYEPDPEGAAIEFRKHLGWYVRGLHNSAALRKKLHAVQSFDEVGDIFREYLASDGFERANKAPNATLGLARPDAFVEPAA